MNGYFMFRFLFVSKIEFFFIEYPEASPMVFVNPGEIVIIGLAILHEKFMKG